MLIELRIKNYALIDELELSFPAGLTVLTGETGAGKSIILEALSLLLGRRAELSMLKDRKKKALVEGVFAVRAGSALAGALEEKGLIVQGELLLQRELSEVGRSRVLVDGRLSTVERLSEIGDLLVDFHGQHKHQSLLKSSCQLDLLDAFGGILKQRTVFRELWRKKGELKKRLLEYGGDPQELERRLDILRFQKKEIEEAKLGQGELIELEKEFAMLENVDRLRLLVGEAAQLLQDEEMEASSPAGALAKATSLLQQAGELEKSLDDHASRAEEISVAVSELAAELSGYMERLEFNADRHGQLRERLDLVNGLMKKYGSDEVAVLAYLTKIGEELENLEGREGKTDSIKRELIGLEEKLAELAGEIGEKRKEAAKRLAEVTEKELTGLGMENSVFEAKLWRKKGKDLELAGEGFAASETGLERADFLLSANTGVEPKPLRSIVSGGELSRIMLGLKVVLGRLSDVPVMVFDEVDTGIGGDTAWSVGERLGGLALTHQLFAVTHLAQIAAFAAHHLLISKETQSGRTVIKVREVKKGEREKEIARMLGDARAESASLEHAREILARASGKKLAQKEKIKK